MTTKEKLKMVALFMCIIATIFLYFAEGMAYSDFSQNDRKIFKVLKFKYDEETGYTLIGETTMDMAKLRSWEKICYFKADKLDSGDILLEFEAASDERWTVKISDRAVIKELRRVEKDYCLKCHIPD